MPRPRQIARALLPRSARDALRAGQRRLLAFRYRGDAVECPCCAGRFARFVPFGASTRPFAMCPGCGAMERHRLLWLYLRERTDLLTGAPHRLLHLAPEPVFHAKLRSHPGLRYVAADLDSPLAMERLDIAHLPHPDDCFDVVLCNHVFEHIPDDRQAMRELRRVLRPGGWAILQVPIRSALPRTLEDPGLTDPAERERRFGQSDHVRQYGLDYPERLREAGFDVKPDGYIADLPEERRRRFGLKSETIYLCR